METRSSAKSKRELPLPERVLYAIPVIGWMLKDVVHGDRDNIWYFLVAVGSLWIIGIMTFGYPAIILPVLVLVPIVFVTLLVITRG